MQLDSVHAGPCSHQFTFCLTLVQPPSLFQTCADRATPTKAGLLISPPAAADSPCKCGPYHSQLDRTGVADISHPGQMLGILGFAGSLLQICSSRGQWNQPVRLSMVSLMGQARAGRQRPIAPQTADLQQLLACPGHSPVYGRSGRVWLTNVMSGGARVGGTGRDSSCWDSVCSGL